MHHEGRQLPRDLENALPRLSNNIDEVQRGYATGMGDTAEKMRYSSNPYDAVLGSPAAQQKLSALFPKGAEKMLRRYDLERQMGKTKYEVMGGSPTAARFQADASLMPAIAEHSGNLMGGMTAGTPTAGTAMRLALTGAKMGMGKSAEKNAAKMAPLLFDQNPAKTLAMFDDLAKRLNANKAYKQKWQKRSGLFGGAAAVPFFTEQ